MKNNIIHSIEGEPLEDYEVTDPAGIHLSLGIVSSLLSIAPLQQLANSCVTV